MTSDIPKYLKDIRAYVESVPYGDVLFLVKRVNNKTVQINTATEETLRYVNNEEAMDHLDKMMDMLSSSEFSGDATVRVNFDSGNIKVIGVNSKKESKYQ